MPAGVDKRFCVELKGKIPPVIIGITYKVPGELLVFGSTTPQPSSMKHEFKFEQPINKMQYPSSSILAHDSFTAKQIYLTFESDTGCAVILSVSYPNKDRNLKREQPVSMKKKA
jgi:hypothetical protein